jgi:dienelactone hydrolase
MPTSIMDLFENKIQKPASWFTTIFYKPIWIVQALSMVIPFFLKNRPGAAKPRIFSFFQALRTSPPPFPTSNLKIGAAGFCWGGKFTVLLAANPPSSRVKRHDSQISGQAIEPLIDCGFTAHPSLLKVPKDIDPITVPLSVAVGNEDEWLSGPLIQQMKEILEKKKDDHEVVIMPGAKHGFAVRTDPKDPFQMECADKAEVQAINWFTRWFA